MLQHKSVDGWRVISAGKCWSYPGQSTTNKKKLQNSQPVMSKKTERRSRRWFAKKGIVVLEENLHVFQGELIGTQSVPGTAVTSYFVWLYVLYSSPCFFLRGHAERKRNTKYNYVYFTVVGLLSTEEGTAMFRKWVTVWGLRSSGMRRVNGWLVLDIVLKRRTSITHWRDVRTDKNRDFICAAARP